MIIIAKRQILLIAILLSTLLLVGVTASNSESNNPPTSIETLQRITSAEREVGYVGKRLLIGWGPIDCFAREELIIHQPPSIHFVKLLTPSPRERAPMRREKWRDRERKHEDGQPEAKGGHRFDGRFFPMPHQQQIELLSRENLELLIQNYDVTFSRSSDEIAGYQTDLLTIKPRFNGRPTKRIWISKDQGIILRLEDLDAEGDLRFLSVYTQISFQPKQIQQALAQAPPKTQPPGDPRFGRTVSLAEAQEAFNHQLVMPTDLPQGFQLQSVGLMKFRSEPTVHLRYTDGLMVLSLFESKSFSFPERPAEEKAEEWGIQMEPIHGVPVQVIDQRQIRILRWSQEKVGLTLIGELSRSEMTQIAESLIRGSAQ